MAKKTEIAQLNSLQRTKLRNLEVEFKAGSERLIEIIAEIDADWLWREYATLAAYIQAKLSVEKSRAYQLIKAVQIKVGLATSIKEKQLTAAADPDMAAQDFPHGVESKSPKVGVLPTSEIQLRQLGKLKDPDQRVAAWQDAVEAAGGPPTTQQVQETVETYLADNKPYIEEEPDDEHPWTPDDDEPIEPSTEERMIEAARKLNALSRAIQAHSKEAEALNDPHLDDIRLNILKSQLRAAGGTLLACRGVQVCKCVRGCKSCRKSGWLTKDVAETMPE